MIFVKTVAMPPTLLRRVVGLNGGSAHAYPDGQAHDQRGDNREQDRVCRTKTWRF